MNSQNSFFLRIIRFLHINKALKKIYYWVHFPFNKEKQIYFEGIKAIFHVDNYEKINILENAFKQGDRDESLFLSTMLKFLMPGDVAYDIGANIGLHTVFLAKKVENSGKIISFEPERKNYEGLLITLRKNKLENVVPLRVALGEKEGFFSLYKNNDRGIGSFSLIKTNKNVYTERVEVIEGDSLIQSKGLPIPKGVKIDVEGYEYQVIRGLKRTFSHEDCQLLCCEIHPSQLQGEIQWNSILEELELLGFTQIETHHRGSEIQAVCLKRRKASIIN